MRNFESYHLIGFLLAYFSLERSYAINVPHLKVTNFVYTAVSSIPFFTVLVNTNSESLEHLLLVLSYVFTERSLGALVTMDNSNSTKLQMSNYVHMIFLISMLILIYNKTLSIQLGYILSLVYTILSLMSRKTSISFALQDYIIIHLIFYFTK